MLGRKWGLWGEDTLKGTHTLTLFCCCHSPSCWSPTSHVLLQPSFWMREAGPVESPEILGDAWVTTDMKEVGGPRQDPTDPLSLVTPGWSPRVGYPSPAAQPTPCWLLPPGAGEVPDLQPGAGARGKGSGYGFLQK